MRFGWTIIYVQDVPATVEFYERAFGLERRFIDPSSTFAELETGGTALAFATLELGREHAGGALTEHDPAAPPVATEVAFETDAVAAAYARALEAGATAVSEPHTTDWGQTLAYVRDLNGALVELATPIPPPE